MRPFRRVVGAWISLPDPRHRRRHLSTASWPRRCAVTHLMEHECLENVVMPSGRGGGRPVGLRGRGCGARSGPR